ncbi:MAG: GspMb/PilO family protein [Vicinamibacterales bacterium]
MSAFTRRVLIEHRRALVPIVLCAILNLLAYGVIVRPLAAVSAGAADRAAAAAAALRSAQSELAAAEALVQGKARADEELDAFYKKVLPADLTSARRMTYAGLPALARRTGVQYEARSTDIAPERDSPLVRMTIRMTLQGRYSDIRQFIYQLESAPEFVIIDDVVLQEGEGDGLRLTVDLSTYYRTRSDGS